MYLIKKVIFISQIDWNNILERWDEQQILYNPKREERFNYMFDILDVQCGQDFTILDIACGPGSISKRVLERFPKSSSIAVDIDPVLLKLGQEALGDYDGRLQWVEANLNDSTWVDKLPVTQVDAILSTTALHWLPVEELIRLYKQFAVLLKPNGVFMDGDKFKFKSENKNIQSLSDSIKTKNDNSLSSRKETETWESWWETIKQLPELDKLYLEREKRFSWRKDAWVDPTLEFQISTLKEVGFKEVDTIWQNLDSRILIALR